jgi:hypothetical protein
MMRSQMILLRLLAGVTPAYYKQLFGQIPPLKPEFQRFIDEWRKDPVAQKQLRIKKANMCHDFEWFDKFVLMRLTGKHHPWRHLELTENS